jgi:hypothetical protein
LRFGQHIKVETSSKGVSTVYRVNVLF